MPFDISEIKKLPVEQKLKIIDELWESVNDYEIAMISQEEENKLLEDRIALYESGKIKFSPWKDVKDRIDNKFNQQ
jgi:putative addiction module component (TIGR02574 family)